MTQAEYTAGGHRKHEWFGLDTLKGQGSISGKAVEDRFKALIDSHITLSLGCCPSLTDGNSQQLAIQVEIPVQIWDWRVEVNDGHGVVQWQFKPKHGEGYVWIDSTSDEYLVS